MMNWFDIVGNILFASFILLAILGWLGVIVEFGILRPQRQKQLEEQLIASVLGGFRDSGPRDVHEYEIRYERDIKLGFVERKKNKLYLTKDGRDFLDKWLAKNAERLG